MEPWLARARQRLTEKSVLWNLVLITMGCLFSSNANSLRDAKVDAGVHIKPEIPAEVERVKLDAIETLRAFEMGKWLC